MTTGKTTKERDRWEKFGESCWLQKIKRWTRKLCVGGSQHRVKCSLIYYIFIIRLLHIALLCFSVVTLVCEMSCEISGCDLHETSFLLGWSAVQQAVNSHFLSSQFHFVPAKWFFGSQKSDRTQVGYLPERLVDPAASKAKVKMNTHAHACAKPATHTHT